MKIYIESYGCTSSRFDSQIMAAILKQKYKLVKRAENADVLIINTCTVKSHTEAKMLTRISKLLTFNKPLIVAGCMPEAQTEKLKTLFPQVSLISTNFVNKIENVVDSVLVGKKIILVGKIKKSKVCLPNLNKKPIGILEICSGCNYACTYCITKLAKGNLFSYPSNQIIKKIACLVKDGFSEIWLTGQDVASYFYKNVNLPDLLNKINFDCKFDKYFIRLGMMNPASVMPILDKLIESYKNPHIFKFAHIPVQSGSNKILKAMNRKYTIADFKKIIASFKSFIPQITIWTDVIVGYPGETEQDFRSTVDLIKEIKPDFVNISKFGPRPGTQAAKLPDTQSKIKNERSKMLSNIIAKISLEKNKVWLGWKGDIIIDEWNQSKRNWIGHNYAYKPVAINGRFRFGQFVNVKIISVTKTHLVGMPI